MSINIFEKICPGKKQEDKPAETKQETVVEKTEEATPDENISCKENIEAKVENTTSDIDTKEAPEEKNADEVKPERKALRVCKMGSDHKFANMNNHDFAFNMLNMKIVMDGCGSGKHSEVGPRIFGQLFARKVKEMFENNETINDENIVNIINNIFEQMLKVCDDVNFIFQNYCFTILICFENEDEFVVYSCGDGYIIKENSEGISFEELDDGEYPAYYIYNFIEDKACLKEYKDGVEFKVSRYSKSDYSNVGVATDGLRYYANLLDVEKKKLMTYLHDGKGPQIEKLINRNNLKNEMFHDDISICF